MVSRLSQQGSVVNIPSLQPNGESGFRQQLFIVRISDIIGLGVLTPFLAGRISEQTEVTLLHHSEKVIGPIRLLINDVVGLEVTDEPNVLTILSWEDIFVHIVASKNHLTDTNTSRNMVSVVGLALLASVL